MYVYSSWQTVTVPATGWQTIDLTGAPFSVPTNAQFVLLRVIHPDIIDFRKPGGTEIYGAKLPYGFAGYQTDVLVPLTSGTFECNASTLTGLTVYAIAYFGASDGLAFSDWVDKTPATANALTSATWITIDVSDVVPSTAKWAVCSIRNTKTGGNKSFRVRKYGTSAYDAGAYLLNGNGSQSFLAPLTTNGKFEVYGQSASVARELIVHGYLSHGEHNDGDLPGTRATIAENTPTWTAQTSPILGQIAVYVFVTGLDSGNTNPVSVQDAGWRVAGSADDIISGVVAGGGHMALVPLDAAGGWESRNTANVSGNASIYGYLLGVLDSVALTEESSTIEDTVLQSLFTPKTAGSSDGMQEAASAVDFASYDRDVEVAESATASDTVSVDRDPLPSEEAATVSDATSATRIHGRATSEATEADDSVIGERIAAPPGAATGEGDVRVSGAGEGITGTVGDGEGSVSVTGSGDGLYGAAGSGEGDVSVTGDGEGETTVAAESTPAGSSFQTFAMNLATGAVTAHSTTFNSRCSLNGKVYAAGPDGIYLIGGRTDNGTAIQATVAKHEANFGSSHEKVILSAWLRLLSEGNLTFQVEADRGGGTVTVTDNIPRMHGTVVKLPRGASGGEHSFTIQNVNGAYFMLPEIEFQLGISDGRRSRVVRG